MPQYNVSSDWRKSAGELRSILSDGYEYSNTADTKVVLTHQCSFVLIIP